MEYLIMLAGIIMINILLSGDNALVIALASRNLPEKQKKIAILWGSIGAVGLRIFLTFAAVALLRIAYLRLAGGVLLAWVAINLIATEEQQHRTVEAQDDLWCAVKTIIAADLVMSVDNVIAVAGAARGNISLLIVGLALSIPIIIWGSKLIGMLLQKWPVIITIGAAFLGWTAGEMILDEQIIIPLLSAYPWAQYIVPGCFAVSVVAVGQFMAEQKQEIGKPK
ncbi:MAG TPA: TerC family protein [Negativicutes bacterium]|jgi:YjbE family integral membrane protein